MRNIRKYAAIAVLSLFGATGCELAVTNLNAPEQERALANASDVEALIGGSWWSWYQAIHNYGVSLSPMLSTMSFQHSAMAANFGMIRYSGIPRVPTINSTADDFYDNLAGPWTQSYRAIAAVNDGLRAMDAGVVDLGEAELRARAYAKFVQGVGHATIAMLYDQGPIVDETTDLTQTQEFVSYQELRDAALGYFDEAIQLAQSGEFHEAIPYDWMILEQEITADRLARMASSYKAMTRAATARTPEEAEQVDWSAVLSEVQNGIQSDITFRFDGGTRWFGSLYYSLLAGAWQQLNYFVFGMADQSGNYQEWMSLPVGERHPNLPSGDPFLIITPDERFAQGSTLEAQFADVRPHPDQRFYMLRDAAGEINVGAQWVRDDRGTWRWSYYRDRRDPSTFADVGNVTPYISFREQRLLAAEAHYRMGNLAEAAAIVNETRVDAGLNATDASGTNTSCVPRLPNGECGDLLEMLKWERRMLASHEGQYLMATMYFDGRRWGDLMEGTILTWPVPCRDAQLEAMTCDDFGGTFQWGAPVGTYGY